MQLVDLAMGMISYKAVDDKFHVFVGFQEGLSEQLVELVEVFVCFDVVSANCVDGASAVGEEQCDCVEDQVEIAQHHSKR